VCFYPKSFDNSFFILTFAAPNGILTTFLSAEALQRPFVYFGKVCNE